ncbi:MAG: beta-lactamase family protein [Alkalibacterium sp.]|nr:beta-lactamase family protein [Alkalibacterium sp.]
MSSDHLSKELLDDVVNSISNKKGVYSMVLSVEHGSSGFTYTQSGGLMENDSSYFIASVTKLYMTVIVMTLIKSGELKLEDPISQYLPSGQVKEINVYKGVDYSSAITIRHLISNTSGIPDYFFHKNEKGNTFADDLLLGHDISWDQDKTIEYVKKLKPKFPPGKKGKAAYSDTNYQLLGKIIENVTGKDIAGVLKEEIFDVLGLDNTYAYTNPDDKKPVPFYYKSKELWVPNYIASVTAEGGIVSTAEDMMCFLRAFFNGFFLTTSDIETLKQWNLILPPPSLFYYGVGLEKLYIPRIISPLKPINEIIGFWGQTGSFAWYNPDTDLYFTGTTNQIDGSGHSAVMKGIIKIIKATR